MPLSETFVFAQGEALRKFTAHYAGSKLTSGLHMPAERTHLVRQRSVFGILAEALFKLFGFAPYFYARLYRLKPVIIHAHFGIDGVLALPIARYLQIPLVVTFHGYDATTKDEYARRSFYLHRKYLRHREMLKQNSHLFIAVSKFIKEKLIASSFPSEKVVVNYIGVDLDIFCPNPLIRREQIVLFVGRLIENKGCEYLIKAMAAVQKVDPCVTLIVIGDGPLRPTLQRLAENQLRRFNFIGPQSSEAVRYWLNRAKIFSVPSVTVKSGESEGFGLVFVEAQAMGVPVVSFATGGITEAVDHEQTGFLVRERDTGALAMSILRLMGSEELWNRFSREGQKRAREMFNVSTQVQSLEDLYFDVLKHQYILPGIDSPESVLN